MTYLRTTTLTIVPGIYIVAGKPLAFSGGIYTVVDLWTEGREVVEYNLKNPRGVVMAISAAELETIMNKQKKPL